MHVGFVYFVQVKSNMMFGVAYLVFVFYGGCGLKQNYLTTQCNGATVAVCLLPLVFVLRFPIGVTLCSIVRQFYIVFNGA